MFSVVSGRPTTLAAQSGPDVCTSDLPRLDQLALEQLLDDLLVVLALGLHGPDVLRRLVRHVLALPSALDQAAHCPLTARTNPAPSFVIHLFFIACDCPTLVVSAPTSFCRQSYAPLRRNPAQRTCRSGTDLGSPPFGLNTFHTLYSCDPFLAIPSPSAVSA